MSFPYLPIARLSVLRRLTWTTLAVLQYYSGEPTLGGYLLRVGAAHSLAVLQRCVHALQEHPGNRPGAAPFNSCSVELLCFVGRASAARDVRLR